MEATLNVTLSTGGLGRAVRRPGRLLSPPHDGGGGDTQQVNGVGLQVLQEVQGLLSRELDLRRRALGAGAVGQAVGRDTATTQLVWQRLPRHLDVGGAAAGEAELGGAEGNCGQTGGL